MGVACESNTEATVEAPRRHVVDRDAIEDKKPSSGRVSQPASWGAAGGCEDPRRHARASPWLEDGVPPCACPSQGPSTPRRCCTTRSC